MPGPTWRYDVSFRFGAIVTILGAADAVTKAGRNGAAVELTLGASTGPLLSSTCTALSLKPPN
jgi:hypothetical protein